MLQLEPEFAYSGFDDRYFAELLPTAMEAWFVVILGQGYGATSDKSYPPAGVTALLRKGPFNLQRAAWQVYPSPLYARNPFLLPLSPLRSLQSAQTGTAPLPAPYQLAPLEVLSPSQSVTLTSAHLSIILTADRQFMRFDLCRHPQKMWEKLQQYHPQPLVLLGAIPGNRQILQSLNQQFAELKSQKEWFRFTPELEKFVLDQIQGSPSTGKAAQLPEPK